MVGVQQQFSGIAKWGVAGEPLRIRMPMGADNRQRRNRLIQTPRNPAHVRISREKAVGVQVQRAFHERTFKADY